MEYTQNYALRKPGLNEYANVGDLNFNADKIDSQMKKNQDVDGEVYDPTSTSASAYEAGDYVINPDDGLMYVCNGTTYGTWDATKWDHTTEFEEIQKAMASGGESELADLHDVEITNPTDGQALLYDDTTDKWHNSDLPDADVTKTASGNPIEFSDGADAPLVKCTTAITGSQDLHGYDKPWVGGAGKNKLQTTGTSTTTSGVTFTVNDDGTVKVNGTSTGVTTWIIGWITIESGNTYTVSGSPNNPSVNSYWIDVRDGSSIYNNWTEDNPTFTATETKQVNVRIRVASGYTINNLVFKPQIELGSTATTFAPYSNICPITAYTEGEIEVGGKNRFDTSLVQNNKSINASGVITDTLGFGAYGPYRVKSGNDVTFGFVSTNDSTTTRIHGYDSFGNWVEQIDSLLTTTEGQKSLTVIIPQNVVFVKVSTRNTFTNMQLETGSTATTYEPYVGTTHTTTYPSAIYRGSEDVVGGVLTTHPAVQANMIKITLTLSDSVIRNNDHSFYINPTIAGKNSGNIISSKLPSAQISASDCIFMNQYGAIRFNTTDAYSTPEAFVQHFFPMDIAYEVNDITPTQITPTNLPIKSLSGYNHIESSTGEMEIEYFPAKEQPLIDLIPEESGGGGTSYDTTEQVIGTWVDGRDVYRKLVTVQATWQNIGTGANQSFAYQENWVKDIDYVTNAIAVSSEQYYANMMHISVQTDKVNGTAVAYWNDAFGGAFTSMYVDYVILEYVKVAPSRSLAKSAPQEEQVEELKEEPTEETKEEPTEEVKEEPEEIKEEPVEEVKEEVKEEETKEEGEVNER